MSWLCSLGSQPTSKAVAPAEAAPALTPADVAPTAVAPAVVAPAIVPPVRFSHCRYAQMLARSYAKPITTWRPTAECQRPLVDFAWFAAQQLERSAPIGMASALRPLVTAPRSIRRETATEVAVEKPLKPSQWSSPPAPADADRSAESPSTMPASVAGRAPIPPAKTMAGTSYRPTPHRGDAARRLPHQFTATASARRRLVPRRHAAAHSKAAHRQGVALRRTGRCLRPA